MTRTERLWLAAVAIVVGVFVAVLVTGVANHLGAFGWFSNGANVIQWVSGPGTLLALAAALAAHWNRTCAGSWLCMRRGEHPVSGTLKKVCSHHHTLDAHLAVHEKHRVSGKLKRGESHDSN